MKIGFVVNRVETESTGYTTSHLALAAASRGHEVFYIGVGDFSYEPTGAVGAHATVPPDRKYGVVRTFLAGLQGDDATREHIPVGELDVLFLRNNPAEDRESRGWAQHVGVLFGRAAARQGVLVVNDPDGLSRAMNKMYLESFPEEVRPRTLITRHVDEIREFITGLEGPGILKPLQGSGGESVFLVREEDHPNLNQIFETISRSGYVIAQEYLEGASDSDIRLFLMNGDPLVVDGEYGAIERRGAQDDVRTNISAGGTVERAKITGAHLEIAQAVRPRLLEDGMFLVGLDLADDKIMEINVFSPGGLHCTRELTGTKFCPVVIEALEAKLAHKDRNTAALENRRLAVL